MPLYSYACAECGPFAAMRSIADFREPAPCPGCGAAAGRVLSAPALLGRTQRRAQGSLTAGSSYQRLSHHGGGCGCCAPTRVQGGR
ncbi:MAG: zinc ribbon domain-containing protein [Variovorax sp.]